MDNSSEGEWWLEMGERLYVGIDLGTYQSTIASSAGEMKTICLLYTSDAADE